jgi:hypothetical protein
MDIRKLVSIQWLMTRKPYSRHTEHDIFYLELTRKLYAAIDDFIREFPEFNFDYEPEDIRELAYMIAGYAEDVFSDIGIFKSVKKEFAEKYGSPFPLTPNLSEEYSDDDIQPEDILFLIWYFHVCQGTGDKDKRLVYPDANPFTILADELFEVLDEHEEFSTTDFYETYLHMPDDADYYDVKEKITWLAFKSYLTGYELEKKRVERVFSNDMQDADYDKEALAMILYAASDELIANYPSHLSALNMCDIFAKTARCSSYMRSQIENLKIRHSGVYHLQGEDDEHYLMHHTGVSVDYKSQKSSFNYPLDDDNSDIYYMTLIHWNGEFQLTGMCVPLSFKGHEIRTKNLELQGAYSKFHEPLRAKLIESLNEFREAWITFFGSELSVFRNGKEAHEKHCEFYKWYHKRVTKKYGNKDVDREPLTPPTHTNLLNEEDVAFFMPPSDNSEILLGHRWLVTLLQSDANQPLMHRINDVNEASKMLLDESVSSDYVRYIFRHYPTKIWDNILKCNGLDENKLEFWLRFYKPYDFAFRKPVRFTIIDSSAWTEEQLEKLRELKF